MDRALHNFFEELIEYTMIMGDTFSLPIKESAEVFAEALLSGNTIFTIGQGASSLSAQLFSNNLALGTQMERPGFPSLNLNQVTDSHDIGQHIKILSTLSKESDILLLLSRGGSCDEFVRIMQSAVKLGLTIVLVAYKDDNILIESLRPQDLCIDMSRFEKRMLSQLQSQIIECLSQLIDNFILGEN